MASGGTGVMMSDAAAEAGLTVPVLPPEVQDELTPLLRIVAGTTKPVAVLATPTPPDLLAARMPCYADPRRAMSALGSLHRHGEAVPAPFDPAPAPGRGSRVALVRELLAGQAGPMADERQALDVLSLYGLAVVEEIVSASAALAAAALIRLRSPVAVTVRAAQLGHKSDIGCVMLNVCSADAARAACHQVTREAAEAGHAASVRDVAGQPMVTAWPELALGIVRRRGPRAGGRRRARRELVEIRQARVGLRPPFGPAAALRAAPATQRSADSSGRGLDEGQKAWAAANSTASSARRSAEGHRQGNLRQPS